MRSSRVNRGRGPLRADLLRCGFTPPASRNHRRPQVADTPTATPASPAHKAPTDLRPKQRLPRLKQRSSHHNTPHTEGGVAKTAGNQGGDHSLRADFAV